MTKKRIGFLIPRLGISDRGAEVVVYELAKRLSSEFFVTVWVRTSKNRSSLREDLQKQGVEIKSIHCFSEESWFVQRLYGFRWLKSFCDRLHLTPTELEMASFALLGFFYFLSSDCDVFCVNSGVWGASVCRLIRIIKKKPFIVIAHGGKEPLLARQHPDAYVALNKASRQWIKKQFPRQNVRFIPNGVDTDRFTPRGEKARISLLRPVFLTVGALIPVKAIDKIINAVAKLQKGSLMIVGRGVLRKQLENQAMKLLGQKRYMITNVIHTDMPFYYRSADVFTLAAQGEPGSLVYVEAMSCGVPVVAQKEDHLAFVIGKGGMLVDCSNEELYSRTLEIAAKTDFGNRPRLQAEKFSWDKITRLYKRLFLEVMNEKN